MDQFTHYVITYYAGLMTPTESAARATVFWRQAAEAAKSEERRRVIGGKLASSAPEVLGLLADGPEQCLRTIRDRILTDHVGDVFLNYCVRCGSLAKTPRARQCAVCFLDWHGEH